LLDAAIAAAQQPLQQKIQELEAKLSKYESWVELLEKFRVFRRRKKRTNRKEL